MTLNALLKELQALVAEGYGRRAVAIDKMTFQHNCENDGVSILDVRSLEPQWVPLADDDGGIAVTSKGAERGSWRIVLHGDAHTPATKRNLDVYRASSHGFCANFGLGVTTHEPITGRCNRSGLPA